MTLRLSQWIKAAGSIGVCASLLFARVEIKTENPDLKLGIGCEGWVESGQMVKFYNLDVELDHAWINHTFLDLTFDAVYKERLKMSFGTEGRMWFNVPKQRGSGQATYVHQENSTFIISDANASYSLGDVRSPWLSITAGLFPYKYNAQARNLGEYLFRSGTYPAYLINNFDLPFARLTGFKVSSELFGGNLHQDLIFNIETEIPPFYDGTLSYLANYNFFKIIDIGAGASFAHLVSVDERITTPKGVSQNQIVDTVTHDTSYYSFRGTKLMGKLCFDPKGVLNLLGLNTSSILGGEDFKIYGEALVLGLEDYKANGGIDPMTGQPIPKKNAWGYDTLKNKVPVIFGINIPAFKLLNVLAFESEWYGCPYPNSYKNRLGPGFNLSYPVPDDPARESVNYAKTDNWKWSLYAKRTFFDDHLGFVVQVARDHIRNITMVNESYDYEEALSRPDQYWWMAKIVTKF